MTETQSRHREGTGPVRPWGSAPQPLDCPKPILKGLSLLCLLYTSGGGDVDFQPAESERLGQRDADLLPAGEVQQGNGQSQVALCVPGVEEGELIAGAVAVNPEVQSGIVVGQVGKASAKRNGQPLCIRAEGVIQLSGIDVYKRQGSIMSLEI